MFNDDDSFTFTGMAQLSVGLHTRFAIKCITGIIVMIIHITSHGLQTAKFVYFCACVGLCEYRLKCQACCHGCLQIILYLPNLTIIAESTTSELLIVPIGLDILTEYIIIFIITV